MDEDPNQAAIREAKEETGFDVVLMGGPRLAELSNDPSDLVAPRYMNRHHFNETHEHIDCVYFATVVGGTLAPEEGVDMRWFSSEDLETVNLLPSTRAYACAALEELQI